MKKFKKYMERITERTENKNSQTKSLFTNLLNSLGVKQVTIGILRRKMPNTLKIILELRKDLRNKLPKAIEKDIGVKMVAEENVDLFKDKNVYNEGASFHGFMMTLPVIWFTFILLLIFGEEQHNKIVDYLFKKGDKLLSRMGLNNFNDNENNN